MDIQPQVLSLHRLLTGRLFRIPQYQRAYSWTTKSTGRDDLREKLPAYRQRGDAEIWLIHPRERSVRIWRRQPDGRYAESRLRGGTVQLAALPGVTIGSDELLQLAEQQ